MRFRWLGVLGGLVAAISFGPSVRDSEAFPTRPEVYFGACTTYAFLDPASTGYLVPTDTLRRDAAIAGFDVWRTAKTWDGNRVVEMEEVPESEADLVVYFDPYLEAGILGQGRCEYHYIRFSIDHNLPTDMDLLGYVAAHEGGHTLGLAHVSVFASDGGDNPPLMREGDPRPGLADYSQDDEAHLINRRGTASPPSLNANQSFERKRKFWRKTGGETEPINANAADGDWHLKWKPYDEDDFLYQVVELSIKIDDIYPDSGMYLQIDGRFNHRRWTNHSGEAKLVMWAHRIDYPGYDPGFLSGDDEHNRTVIDTLYYAGGTGWVEVGPEWDWTTTNYEWFPPYPTEGVELELRIFSTVRGTGGTLQWLRLDNVRARELTP